jgi:hypothetical protein
MLGRQEHRIDRKSWKTKTGDLREFASITFFRVNVLEERFNGLPQDETKTLFWEKEQKAMSYIMSNHGLPQLVIESPISVKVIPMQENILRMAVEISSWWYNSPTALLRCYNLVHCSLCNKTPLLESGTLSMSSEFVNCFVKGFQLEIQLFKSSVYSTPTTPKTFLTETSPVESIA